MKFSLFLSRVWGRETVPPKRFAAWPAPEIKHPKGALDIGRKANIRRGLMPLLMFPAGPVVSPVCLGWPFLFVARRR